MSTNLGVATSDFLNNSFRPAVIEKGPVGPRNILVFDLLLRPVFCVLRSVLSRHQTLDDECHYIANTF